MPDGTNVTAGPARACGGCTACCKTHGLNKEDTLGIFLKRPGEWCQYCDKGRGCRIYGEPERPNICRTFSCAWLDGNFYLEDRPDRVKLVVEAQQNTFAGTVLLLWGLTPDSFRSPFAEERIRKTLLLGYPVLLISFEGARTLLVPNNMRSAVPRDQIAELGIKIEDRIVIDFSAARALAMGVDIKLF